MQVAFPVRPILDRHQIELRIRIEAVERDIMLGGPHQRRELAGRHRLLGRRERAAPAALDLDDMEHALAQSHDVEFVTPAAPISMQQLEPVGNKPFGRRLLAPQARLARLHG